MTTVAVIIARMGSTRLPGKVLMDLDGFPVLEWVVTAARAAPGVDRVVVATSTLPGDDAIERWCASEGTPVFRGSETDVLHRVHCAAAWMRASIVVRITGDCPFIDSEVIGAVVRLRQMTDCAYASNVGPRTWPDGLDVEAFTMDALRVADKEATRPIDRECVTTWIQRNRSRFPAEALICPLAGLEKERWVLDTKADYLFCQQLAAETGRFPSYLDILRALDRRPELRAINAQHPTNERYYEALTNEPITSRVYTRSQAQFERAHKVIPLAAQTFSKSYVQFPDDSPLFLTHGQGGVVWDADGNEYVDLVSALLPNVLGYRDPDVDHAIRRQLSAGISFSLATELEAQLAETLVRLIPCAEMVRFGKNGTDVTSAAIRLARAYTGRERVLMMRGGYHGWQDWSVAGSERDLGVPQAVRGLTDRVAYGDIPAPDIRQYAAIIIEPESEQGLAWARDACDKAGALLIFDEVITGFRFGLGGAQKLYGVTPDLATFGKAMANGMPLSALVGRAEIMRKLEPPNPCVFYSGTFAGETLSLAAASATIAKLERERVIQHLWNAGNELAANANYYRHNNDIGDLVWLHGQPPLMRLGFRDQAVADVFRREMIASGTLIIGSNNVCFAHGHNELKRATRSYEHAFAAIKRAFK